MQSESKRDRFIRLAEARTNKALQLLHLIGNLSFQGNYDYSAEDVEKIFSAIEAEIAVQKQRFFSEKASKNFSFTIEEA